MTLFYLNICTIVFEMITFCNSTCEINVHEEHESVCVSQFDVKYEE